MRAAVKVSRSRLFSAGSADRCPRRRQSMSYQIKLENVGINFDPNLLIFEATTLSG